MSDSYIYAIIVVYTHSPQSFPYILPTASNDRQTYFITSVAKSATCVACLAFPPAYCICDTMLVVAYYYIMCLEHMLGLHSYCFQQAAHKPGTRGDCTSPGQLFNRQSYVHKMYFHTMNVLASLSSGHPH